MKIGGVFDYSHPGVSQHDPDPVPAQYRTSMDQGALWDTQENRNDPFRQRSRPRYPRLPSNYG